MNVDFTGVPFAPISESPEGVGKEEHERIVLLREYLLREFGNRLYEEWANASRIDASLQRSTAVAHWRDRIARAEEPALFQQTCENAVQKIKAQASTTAAGKAAFKEIVRTLKPKGATIQLAVVIANDFLADRIGRALDVGSGYEYFVAMMAPQVSFVFVPEAHETLIVAIARFDEEAREYRRSLQESAKSDKRRPKKGFREDEAFVLFQSVVLGRPIASIAHDQQATSGSDLRTIERQLWRPLRIARNLARKAGWFVEADT